MNVATYVGLVQIDLNIFGVANLFVILVVQTDPDQAIARQNLAACSGRTQFNDFGNDALPGVSPLHAIPGRRFVSQSLGEVKYASRDQQSGPSQDQPCSSCENR